MPTGDSCVQNHDGKGYCDTKLSKQDEEDDSSGHWRCNITFHFVSIINTETAFFRLKQTFLEGNDLLGLHIFVNTTAADV